MDGYGSLDLLKDLATHPEVHDLLLIGAFRDNEVGPAHPLVHTLDAIRKASTCVHDILIGPLAAADLSDLVADTLRCDGRRPSRSEQLVRQKTLGNPFFAIQFLNALSEEHLLVFDAQRGPLELGPQSHPRTALHRQCGRSHGGQAGPSVRRRARNAQTACLLG